MAFMDPENGIKERLEARIAAADWTGASKPRVLTADVIASIEEQSQIAPAFYVLFDGYQPTQQVGNGKVQQIDQDWRVVIVVKNARGQTTGEGLRAEASNLIELVTQALAGYQVNSGFTPLQIAPGPGPQFTGQFGYFSVNLKTRVMVRGT